MRFSLLAVGLLAFAAVASASTTYSSSGVFNCTSDANLTGCGTNQLNLASDILITFVGQAGNTITPPSGAPFGDIIVSCLAGGTPGSETCGPETLSEAVSLTITMNETNPASASGSLSLDAILSTGNLSASSTGTVSISWVSPSTVTLGTDLYSIGPANLPLVPPNSGSPQFGDLSLQGTITDQSTPEPATFALMAGGLGLLGFMRRRKV